jgi:hypothetical protein
MKWFGMILLWRGKIIVVIIVVEILLMIGEGIVLRAEPPDMKTQNQKTDILDWHFEVIN